MCKFDIDCRFLLYIRNQKSKNILYGKNRIVYFFLLMLIFVCQHPIYNIVLLFKKIVFY